MLHSTLAGILSTKHRPHHPSRDEEHIAELGISISTDQEISLKEAEKQAPGDSKNTKVTNKPWPGSPTKDCKPKLTLGRSALSTRSWHSSSALC